MNPAPDQAVLAFGLAMALTRRSWVRILMGIRW
jgi:hypothetical protein